MIAFTPPNLYLASGLARLRRRWQHRVPRTDVGDQAGKAPGALKVIAFSIPIKAPSTPNLREHWAVKAKRADAQKRAARTRCPVWTQGPLLIVKLTRVGPRQLDGDNLQGAMKAIRDGIATWLRIDDGSPLVRWEYEQRQGEPCVLVEVRPTAMSP